MFVQLIFFVFCIISFVCFQTALLLMDVVIFVFLRGWGISSFTFMKAFISNTIRGFSAFYLLTFQPLPIFFEKLEILEGGVSKLGGDNLQAPTDFLSICLSVCPSLNKVSNFNEIFSRPLHDETGKEIKVSLAPPCQGIDR